MSDGGDEALRKSKGRAFVLHSEAQNRGRERQAGHLLATFGLALAGCLWGTGFLFGKIAFREMTVSENVAFRFICGSIALVPALFRKSIPIRRRDLWLLLLASGIGVPLQFLVQFTGLRLTTVSHASLIVGTLPVLLALGSALFLHERLDLLEWGILLVSGLGAVLIALSKTNVTQGPRPSPLGDLLVFVSLLAAVVMILVTKQLMKTYDSLQVTALTIIMGTVWLVSGAELFQPLRFRFSTGTWAAVAAQGVLATTAAYLLWNWGLARVPACRAGVFLNLEPLVGTLLGVLILHESLGPRAILGGLMIIASALYFTGRSKQA